MLSISIVLFNTDPGVLKKLLESIQQASSRLPEKYALDSVKLIDNSQQSQEMQTGLADVLNLLPVTEIIPTGRNLGFGRAHNIAIGESKSRYHLILNPDVILDIHCLEEGLRYLEQHPEVTAVSPHAEDENGKLQYLSKKYPSVVDLVLRAILPASINSMFSTRLDKYKNKEIVDNGKPGKVQIISGCFMLARTDALKAAGGFDEKYFLYFEDFALSLELGRTGILHYLPSMKIVHSGGNASGKGIRHILYFISSGIKFFNRYGWKLL